MRRKAMAFLLAFALAAAAYGAPVQTGFRLWGGLTLAKYEGLPVPSGIPEIRYQNAWRTGFGFGAGVELGLSRIPLALILDLSYLEKGTNLDVYNLDNKINTLPFRLGALSHSGLAKISRRGNWTPYLLAGYELAFITRHRGQAFDSGGPDLMADTKKVDFGLVAGAGLEFRQKKASPFLEFRYYHGLTNLSRGTGSLEYFSSFKCRTMLLSAGLKFGK